MSRKYWAEDELNALRYGFEFHVGLPWSDAVNLATEAGTVRRMQITPEQWAHVAAIVVTRTAEQCAKRMQTERRQEQDRRAALSAAEPPDHWDAHDEEDSANASTRIVNGCNVSPYLGQASGRIVLSFNGRGAA